MKHTWSATRFFEQLELPKQFTAAKNDHAQSRNEKGECRRLRNICHGCELDSTCWPMAKGDTEMMPSTDTPKAMSHL